MSASEKNETITSAGSADKVDNFCLKWSNYHAHFLGVLVELMEAESLVDVTLCTSNGERLYAHKIVLCAASPYFGEILSELDDMHPVVILCETESRVLRCILDFVYHGELNVQACLLNEVLQVACSLQIRGLAEVNDQLPLLVPSASDDETTSNLQGDEACLPVGENVTSEVLVPTSDHIASYSCDGKTQTKCVTETIEEYNSSSLSEVHLQAENPVFVISADNCQVQPQAGLSPSDIDEANITSSENWISNNDTSNELLHLKKKKRRESCRKDYSEEQLSAALRDLRNGQLLKEAASIHKIPRSTLYVRAKAEGIPITVVRQEHSGENITAAVQAVCRGASLQQASDMYQIPKTVLWRRVKAVGGVRARPPTCKQTYGPLHWQAAIQALQDGQNLSRVSSQFKIPKSTLFREKVRLIEAGKLPLSSVQRRDTESHSSKLSRLKEAVAACKEGKMSQAVASITYQVPKTTIWRRLHKGIKTCTNSNDEAMRSVELTESGLQDQAAESGTLQEESQFTFIEGNSHTPVTYIVEDFPASSLII